MNMEIMLLELVKVSIFINIKACVHPCASCSTWEDHCTACINPSDRSPIPDCPCITGFDDGASFNC